jgi:outer membrane lipoprotein-sorting protein
MKKLILIITFYLPTCIFAQDNKAKLILDQLSVKTKSYSNIEAHFTNSFVSVEAGVNEQQNGILFVEDNSYKLKLKNQTVISDGETNWFILEDENEVNITEVDEEEGFNPSNIFNMYEQGYKYNFIKEDLGKFYIELYPTTEGMFSKLVMIIDKNKMEIKSLTMIDKNNSQYTYNINKFITNQEFPKNYFYFNKLNYPNIDIIDLR